MALGGRCVWEEISREFVCLQIRKRDAWCAEAGPTPASGALRNGGDSRGENLMELPPDATRLRRANEPRA